MERTRWPTTYKGVRRDILLGLAEMPCPWHWKLVDYRIASGSSDMEPDLFSPWEDEQRLEALMPLVDRMFDRCEETVRHTSRSLLCWLRSTKPQSCYPKPFTLVALDSSKKAYRRRWKRFLAFAFRLYRMSSDVRRCLPSSRSRAIAAFIYTAARLVRPKSA
jgi:hypothetical protein